MKNENNDLTITNDSQKVVDNKNILLTVLKRHKIGLLIIILLVMISSTFAWFIYNTAVDVSLNAHVKTWNIELGNEGNEDVYEIKIEALYPGMATIDTSLSNSGIPIHNAGEVAAVISINITSITLFIVTLFVVIEVSPVSFNELTISLNSRLDFAEMVKDLTYKNKEKREKNQKI